MNAFNDIVDALKQGEFVIVYDEHREKESDFFLLAEHVTPEKINFLMTYGKGMICIGCDESLLDQKGLGLLSDSSTCPHGTNYCMSFDAKDGITTGISASDRAKAIACLVDASQGSETITTPGHSFPLLAKDPKERFGHTDSGVALAKKAGAVPAMVICEILNESGEIASLTEVEELCDRFNVPMTTLESLRNEFVG